MCWRTRLRGSMQGDLLTPLVFVLVLCVSQTFSQTAPTNPTISAPLSANEGTQVTFNCSTLNGNPLPSVTWYKGNNVIDSTYSTGSQSGQTVSYNDYTFTTSRNDHGVSFRCEVQNVALSSPLVRTWLISVYVQPGSPAISGPSVVNSGTTYTYSCVSSGGNPAPNINWRLDTTAFIQGIQNSIVPNNDNTYTVTSNLTWVPVVADSGKSLVCEVEHSQTLNTKLTDSITISVQVLPVISTSATSYTRNVGESVTLNCAVTAANPGVQRINWVRTSNSQSVNITIDGSKYTGGSVSNPSLTISSIQTTDAGQYQCEAINSVGTGRGLSIALSVTGTTPTVQVGSSVYTVNAGNTASLVCTITSQNPAANAVLWQRFVNSALTNITITGRYSGGTVSSPTLVISNVQASDKGTYYCSARNSIGQGQTAQTYLDVQSPPSVSIPASTYPVNYGGTTTVVCDVTATPSATIITWYRVVNGVDQNLSISGNWRLSGGTPTNPSLTITSAVFGDEGSYRCEATNVVGSTKSTTTFVDVIGSTPSVNIPSSSYSATYGAAAITLVCDVAANPAATAVSWQQVVNSQSTTINVTANPSKYAGSSTTTPSLTIYNLASSDTGYYVCSATNAAGTTLSGQTYLNVTGNTPSVNAPQTAYSQNYGSSVTLQCSASGTPSVTSVYWTKTTNGVTTNITTATASSSSKYAGVTTGNPSLSIVSLTLSDEGSYVCYAMNSVGSSSSSPINLDVIGGLPSVSVLQSSYSVNYGNSITINCTFTSNPAATNVSWQRTSGGVSTVLTISGSSKYTGGTLSSPSLVIFNAVASDEGFYTCSVTNAVGTASSSSAYLDVVATIPIVSIPSSSYSVNYGSTITIPCSVSANPFQTGIQWRRSSNGVTTTLTISGRYSGSTTNQPSLTISGAELGDEGTYVCYATNDAGTGNSDPTTLDVIGNTPSVSVSQSQVNVVLGNNATIFCSYSANPTATAVSWNRTVGGVTTTLITVGRFSGGSTSSPSLTITNVQSSDEGSYRCLVSNAIGQGQSAPVFLDVTGSAPSPVIPQNTYSVITGSSVTIQCTVTATPTATNLYWQISDSPNGAPTNITATGPKYSGGTIVTPSLTINDANYTIDEGYYRCLAENAAGVGQSGLTFLDVSGNVPAVTIPSSSYTAIFGSNVTLPCTISSNPGATSMRWEKTSGSNTDIISTAGSTKYSGANLTTPSLTIYNLNFDDQASYRCIASNQVGDGFSISTFLTISGNSPNVNIPQSLYSSLIGTSVQIPCSISANPATNDVYWLFNPSGGGNNVRIDSSTGRYTVSSNTNNPTLSISGLVFADQGTYTCTAVNIVGTGTDVATLNVTGSLPSVNIPQTSYSVLTGNSITIPCTFTASPAATGRAWMFDPSGVGNNIWINATGGRYTLGSSLNSPSLTISNTVTGDAGTYTCYVSNLVGTTSDSASLSTTGAVPIVSIPSSAYSTLQGTAITLPCNVDNNPTPAINGVTWYYSTTPNNPSATTVDIAGTARYTGGSTSVPALTITGALPADQGYYACSVSNPVGTGVSGETYFTVTGSSPSSPTISQGSGLTVIQTNTLTLQCSASGDPAPTITWTFNGQTLTSTNGVYTKVNIQRADDGVYTCTATNSLGTQTSTVDVNVEFAPVAASASVSLSVASGQSATLNCNVEANPAASYQWSRNNVVIGTNSATYTATFSTGDFGEYICQASNSRGSTTVTFTVSQSSLDTGASAVGGGLSAGEIAAIVLAVLLLLLLLIVICICCCTHGVCGVICGKKKEPKGRVEPSKEKEIYVTKETEREIVIPRFHEEKPKAVREPSAVSRKDVDVKVNHHYRKENDYDIIRYETVPPPSTRYGETIISVQDDIRASPRPHHLPALTTYTYDEEERRRKRRKKKKKHHRRRHHDDGEEVIIEKVRSASPVRVIEEQPQYIETVRTASPVRIIEEQPAETVVVERVRTASPVRYIEEPTQDVVLDYVNPDTTTVIYSSDDRSIVETVRRSPSARRRRSDEEEMIVERTSRSPSRRRRHEERYITTERVVNGDVYRDSGEYTMTRHGSGRYIRDRTTDRRQYEDGEDVEVVPGEEYYVERR